MRELVASDKGLVLPSTRVYFMCSERGKHTILHDMWASRFTLSLQRSDELHSLTFHYYFSPILELYNCMTV